MKHCTDITRLAVAGQLSLLDDPSERGRVDAHLDGCEHCRQASQAVGLALTLPEGTVPDVWEVLSARVEADRRRKQLKILLDCSFCHAALGRNEAVYCAGCLAPHHGDCFQEHGRCSTAGCGETQVVQAARQVSARPVKTARNQVWLTGAMLLAGAMAGAAIAAWNSTDSEHAEPLGTPTVAPSVSPTPVGEGISVTVSVSLERQLYLQAVEIVENKRAYSYRDARSMLEHVSAESPDFASANEYLGRLSAELDAQAQAIAEAPPPQVRFENNRLSLEADGCALALVMQEIGAAVGQNILVDTSILERVWVSLRDIDWQEAVEVIAQMTRCEVEKRPGGILLLTQPVRVALRYHEVDVRRVITELAAMSGKNIVICPEFQGQVSMDLRDIHWLRALYATVRTMGDFAVVEDMEDLLRVVPTSSIQQAVEAAETVLIPLDHLSSERAKQLHSIVQIAARHQFPDAEQVDYDDSSQTLIITASKSQIRLLRDVLERAGRPTDPKREDGR